MKEKINEMTPIEYVKGIWFKREDKFEPFGDGINGSKARQCFCLIEKNKDKIKDGIITATSINSPQAPIIARISEYYKVPCTIFYGGTSEERLKELKYPKMVKEMGAKIEIVSKCPRQSVLQSKVNKRIKETKEFNVKYGMDLKENIDVFIESVANQVQNLPNGLDNLVISCGSGITTIGILLGLELYKKVVKRVYVIGIAPNRLEKIKKYVKMLNEMYEIEIKMDNVIYVDAFNELKGYKYENVMKEQWGDIVFHTRYEAKTFRWLKNNIDFDNETTCMWIIGGERNEIQE